MAERVPLDVVPMSNGISRAAMDDEDSIRSRIFTIRGVQVMLDRDLAALYGVEVKQLNRQAKRNHERFPPDFMFQLSREECVRCQIGTINGARGHQLVSATTQLELTTSGWGREKASREN